MRGHECTTCKGLGRVAKPSDDNTPWCKSAECPICKGIGWIALPPRHLWLLVRLVITVLLFAAVTLYTVLIQSGCYLVDGETVTNVRSHP